MQIFKPGDGNCFYRGKVNPSLPPCVFMHSSYQALAYAYLSSLIDSPNLVFFAKAVIESGSRMMERNNMDADIISTFCEPLMDLVDAVGSSDRNQRLTRDRLLSAFIEEESKAVRCMTLPHLKLTRHSVELYCHVLATVNHSPNPVRGRRLCWLSLR